MSFTNRTCRTIGLLTCLFAGLGAVPAIAQAAPPPERQPATRMFGKGHPFAIDELPAGPFQDRLRSLSAPARARALELLHRFAFPTADLACLRIDDDGGVYYADPAPSDPAPDAAAPVTAEATGALPVSPFPDALKFHSRPGAIRSIYLDFDGETVTGTAWNNSLGRDPIEARPFSADSDTNTYSSTEQNIIRRVWQRVAEDYAPFDVDVTTELPFTMPTHTAHALITRNTDASGQANPSYTSGGVAYVNVFGEFTYTYYSPAWIYANNVGNVDASIAEAVAHEIGHNLGLSHDGRIGGSEYYSGHGTGDISWAPIMGTGYSKNVTQWNRGEYYLADNPEDDLAIITQDLPYRGDDHGDVRAAASPLQVLGGTQIASTTPETDPDNTSPANKGILERTGDIDVFRFASGAGAISLDVAPWISPTGTRGGNIDLIARLYDVAGSLLAEANPANQTGATLTTDVAAGIYYLELEATGAGDPMVSSATGYTDFGCIGQYFISGSVVDGGAIVVPPQAAAVLTDIRQLDLATHDFEVLYTDDAGIDVGSLGSADIRVTGPAGYDRFAGLVTIDVPGNGTPRTATYAVAPPGSTWTAANNGTYTVQLLSNAVFDVEGAYAPAGVLGTFDCRVPEPMYTFPLTTDPGWTRDAAWAFGIPAGAVGDPSAGASGANVLGVNLQGAYARNLGNAYVTSEPLDFSEATGVTLRFQRWLGVAADDTAIIQVSNNGSQWTTVWSAVGAVEDAQWNEVVYDLSAVADGQPAVRVRWGMGSDRDPQVSCGWNLDDIQFLGTLPTVPPPTWALTVTVNRPDWGSATPSGGTYPDTSVVELTATPSNYYRFVEWQGSASSTNNPHLLTMYTNQMIEAVFAEILTTAFPTPHWWLAEQGYTNDFESAVQQTGLNGMPVWASYIAGLDPNEAASELRLELLQFAASAPILSWSTVSGRVYSVSCSTNLLDGFAPVPGAQRLPWTQTSTTATVDNADARAHYRLEVEIAP